MMDWWRDFCSLLQSLQYHSNEIRALNIDEPDLSPLLYIIHCFNYMEQKDTRRSIGDADQRIIYSYSKEAQKVNAFIFTTNFSIKTNVEC